MRAGDTLSDIAEANGLSLAELRALNSLKKGAVIRPGQTLRVRRRPSEATGAEAPPRADRLVSADRPGPASDKTSGTRTEKKVDTASREGAPDRPTARPSAARTYHVKPGDTLWHIARDHGLTIDRLRELNGMAPEAVIQPGQTLKVSGRS